jgi:hypothetical protein
LQRSPGATANDDEGDDEDEGSDGDEDDEDEGGGDEDDEDEGGGGEDGDEDEGGGDGGEDEDEGGDDEDEGGDDEGGDDEGGDEDEGSGGDEGDEDEGLDGDEGDDEDEGGDDEGDEGPCSDAGEPRAGAVTACVRVSPLGLDLLVPVRPVAPGKRFDVRVDVHNNGEVRLRNIAVTLHLDERLLAPAGFQQRRQGLLQAGHSTSLPLRLVAQESGHVIVVASVTAIDENGGELLTAESEAVVVLVK